MNNKHDDKPSTGTSTKPARIDIDEETTPASFREMVRRYEIKVIDEALKKNDFNESRTAKYLKMDRNTLRRIRARARKYKRIEVRLKGSPTEKD